MFSVGTFIKKNKNAIYHKDLNLIWGPNILQNQYFLDYFYCCSKLPIQASELNFNSFVLSHFQIEVFSFEGFF